MLGDKRKAQLTWTLTRVSSIKVWSPLKSLIYSMRKIVAATSVFSSAAAHLIRTMPKAHLRMPLTAAFMVEHYLTAHARYMPPVVKPNGNLFTSKWDNCVAASQAALLSWESSSAGRS